MLEPGDRDTRAWDEQDGPRRREPIAHSSAMSSSARRSIARSSSAAGFASREELQAVSPAIARLPLTDKAGAPCEACTPEKPDRRASLCVPWTRSSGFTRRAARTAPPSYIPLTADRPRELGHRVCPQLREPRGSRPAERLVSTYNAGPFVDRCRARRVRRASAVCHIPVGDRQHRTADHARLEAAAAGSGWCCTPSYAALSPGVGGEAGTSTSPDASVERVHRRPESRVAASRPFAAKLEHGWGAQGHRSDGDRRHRPRRCWGECRRSRQGMHFSARAASFTSSWSIRRRARAVALEDGAERRARATRICSTEAAPLVRFRSRDHVVGRTRALPLRPHRSARALHRPHRRHADRARRQRLSLGRA